MDTNNTQKDTEAAFKWIVSIIQKHNIPFQIGGGFAARVYGVKKELADIDIAMPTNRLADLLPDLKDYITWDLGPFADENWEVTGMTVKYKGQEIDLVGAQGKKFLNQKTKQWVVFE